MAGTEKKRIIELTEASTIQNGDFIAVDSNARGTKKVSTDTLATSAALTAETNARAGADEQMSERMDGIEEQTALIQNPTKTLTGALVSFTDGADMPMVACTAEIVPKQSGTGTPSPENVRPISGWTEVNSIVSDEQLFVPSATVIGKNWIGGDASNRAVNSFSVEPSTDYRVITKGGNFSNVLLLQMNGYTQINNQSIKPDFQWTITTAENCNRIIIQFESDGDMSESSFFGFVCSVSKTSTLYTTPLGRTVYGGTLDVVAGVLTAYPFYPSYNGETLNGRWLCDRAVYAEGTTPPTGSQVALISGTGTTYTLTGQEVSTLLGENNVWADSGDVEITYRRDISIVINNLESALNG